MTLTVALRKEIAIATKKSYNDLARKELSSKEALLESYLKLYHDIPRECFPKNTSKSILRLVSISLFSVITKINSYISSSNLVNSLLPPFDCQATQSTLTLQNKHLDYLDLDQRIKEDFHVALKVHSKKDLVSSLNKGASFITTPLQIAIKKFPRKEKSTMSLPLKTHFFFHSHISRGKTEKGEKLGEGSYGIVEKCVFNNLPIAIKTISSSETNSVSTTSFEIETCSLLQLRHPNIISLLAVNKVASNEGPTLYLELADTSLEDFLESKSTDISDNFCDIDNLTRLKIAKGVASALAYIHKKKIIHKDVTASNILLTKEKKPKLCDFGFATLYNKEKYPELNPYYAAPESLSPNLISEKCDVYSFGVVLFNMFTNNHPYPPKKEEIDENNDIDSKKYKPRIYSSLVTKTTSIASPFSNMDWDLHDPTNFWRPLISHCIEGCPTERYSMNQVVSDFNNQS